MPSDPKTAERATDTRWIRGSFRNAIDPDRLEDGLLCGGLALTKLWNGSPKGLRAPAWTLTHIGTGHTVCNFEARDPFPFADAVVDAGNWQFSGLDGYKNLDPDLPTKVRQVLRSSPNAKLLSAGGRSDEAAARAVAMVMS